MRLRRGLTAGLLGLIAVVAGPASWATAAAPAPAYPPTTTTVGISLSNSVVQVGASVTVSGSGFQAGTPVSVTSAAAGQGFSSRPLGFRAAAPSVDRLAAAAVAAGPDGSFSTTLTFDQPGNFTITASGISAGGASASASASVVVVAAGGGVGGPGTGGGSGTGSGTGAGAGTGSGSGSASGVGGLPNTGASIGLPVTIGAILVLAGAALVTAFRRRKREDATV
jgi:LPXTG-motif cell wall-anchored protein